MKGPQVSQKFFLSLSLLASLVSLSSSAAFAGSFAAIAYNPSTHHWGENHGAANLGYAEARALAACSGGGCQIASWVHEGYVALADGPTGWGAATSANLADAENRALANCEARSTGCHIAVWASGF
jgi:hypothetical protein